MSLDIRLPIGMLFSVVGGLMVVYGLLSDRAIYARSLGINVNLWWGLVLIVFGAIMWYFGQRGSARASSGTAEPPPAGSHPHPHH